MAGFGIPMLLFGAVECFFGFKLYRAWCAILGLAFGAFLGVCLGAAVSVGEAWGPVFFGLLLALVFAFLFYKFYAVGVFFDCLAGGALFTFALIIYILYSTGDLISDLYYNLDTYLITSGVVGVLLGILGAILVRPVLILTSAACGAALFSGGLFLFGMPGQACMVLLVLLLIAGAWFQFKTSPKKLPKSKNASVKEESSPNPITVQAFEQPEFNAVLVQGSSNPFDHFVSEESNEHRKGTSRTQILILSAVFAAGLVLAGVEQNGMWIIFACFADIVYAISITYSGSFNSPTDKNRDGLSKTITNSQSTHSIQNWKVHDSINGVLWNRGFPIAVTESAVISTQNDFANIFFIVGFQNLTEQTIKAVEFQIDCYDVTRDQLKSLKKVIFQDFQLPPGYLYFSKEPRHLPDSNTRKVEFILKTVVFNNGEIWNAPSFEVMQEIARPGRMTIDRELRAILADLSQKYVKEYDTREIFGYQPEEKPDHWYCACGQVNLSGSNHCIACGMEKEVLFKTCDPITLARSYEEKRKRKVIEAEEHKIQREQKKQANYLAVLNTVDTVKEGTAKTIDKAKSSLETFFNR